MRSYVRFFKAGDAMGVETNHIEPDRFLEACAGGLAQIISDGRFTDDMEFQLSHWLPQMTEIACKLKGYKADVHVQQVVSAGFGDFKPAGDDLVYETSAASEKVAERA